MNEPIQDKDGSSTHLLRRRIRSGSTWIRTPPDGVHSPPDSYCAPRPKVRPRNTAKRESEPGRLKTGTGTRSGGSANTDHSPAASATVKARGTFRRAPGTPSTDTAHR
jgi:hypothetical protein